jgi:hypothetical protein
MEFDKSRIYTAVNADELHEGDLVYAADSLGLLESRVKKEVKDFCGTITSIGKEHEVYRFNLGIDSYGLAYLVERAPEKKWRPFKDIDELKDSWERKTNMPTVIGTMSLIWAKYKNPPNEEVIILGFDNLNNMVFLMDDWVSLGALFDKCTFLDGTPCGVEEVI